MKKIIIYLLPLLCILHFNSIAQEVAISEKYGKTINVGLGMGYYSYSNRVLPAFHADFEFDVAKNFTLAPFITFLSYQNNYYWGNPNYPYRNYSYQQTIIPIGVKATYYFDQLVKAGSKWDFYFAGSLGFVISQTNWENGYNGETNVIQNHNLLYLDFHIGSEYHINNRVGLLLDISSGISTFGIAIHP